jgi:hypothetical protein
MNSNTKTMLSYVAVAITVLFIFSFLALVLALGINKVKDKEDVSVAQASACECSKENVENSRSGLTDYELINLLAKKEASLDSKLDSSDHDALLKELVNSGYGEFYINHANEKAFRMFSLKARVIETSSVEANSVEPSETIENDVEELVEEPYVEESKVDGISDDLVEKAEEYRKPEVKKENIIEKVVKSPWRLCKKIFGKKDK